MLYYIKKLIPKKLFRVIQPIYHFKLALLGALIYRFPSRKINVVAITGTKGKTSTAEIVNAFLEEAGFKTALAGTLRFKIGENSKNNMYKMTMPGRFTIQKFLRDAVNAKCDYAIIEMTSEGAKQFRHKFINLNALIFTNISPEHIESHGSFEKYLKAKLKIAKALENSPKPDKVIIVNTDDKEANRFLETKNAEKYNYSLENAKPFNIENSKIEFTFNGEKMVSYLTGEFNLYNILGAATYAKTQKVSNEQIKNALLKLKTIRGRMEKIELENGNPFKNKQNFSVIVDYAHTPDSLEKAYKAFPNNKKICVLGNTGGGRDKWKRVEMGKIADKYCSEIILTNEDPYDENPEEIVNEMKKGTTNKPVEIIMDRREAINKAISKAENGDVVIITGKGTDPYIMIEKGGKIQWSDAKVAREELQKVLEQK